jgi:hypothetical protein
MGLATTRVRRTMMKRMYRVALMLGLVAAGAVSVEAAESYSPDDEITNEIYVVNNYVAPV